MAEKDELSQDRKDKILELVRMENMRALGFDNVNAGELIQQREKALQYYKGEMTDLVMNLAGRSKVVSLDVADAIETALPDLIDIFTGGDDVVSFMPVNEDDVEAAEQEEAYLRHVVFQRNSGWMVIYEAFKDALMCKTGVFSWRWDGEFEPPSEHHEDASLMDLLRCQSEGTVEDIVRGPDDDQGQPTFSFEFTPKNAKGRIIIESIAPEDLAVATDTKTLATATYVAVRQRPRAQDLIAMGYDKDLVDMLPPWNNASTQPEMYARDTVDESMIVGTSADDLRQVEIYRHYVRYYDEDEGEYCLYQVITGGKGFVNMMIDIEEVSRIQLAAITPYINPHRFYGDSVADKLMEIQKIKTSLMRMSLDSGYFAMNQRMELAEDGMTANTLSDLLANEPGMPIRVKRTGTVKPVSAGALTYDPLQHLEYFSTVAEQRTGIVRNAQGLNPDTLHDTKGGVEILQNNAQKRLRLIARTFAETGYKDFLVNLHATIRENGASMRDTVRLLGKWVNIDPSSWRQRDDMVIEIGVGAGGRDHDIIVGQQLATIQEKLMLAQGEPDGPLIDKQKLFASATWYLQKLGVKSPEKFIGDPSQFQPPPQAAPPPDPNLIKVQGQLQIDQQKAQADMQSKQADAQAKMQQNEINAQSVALQHEREMQKQQHEAFLKQYQIDAEIELRRQQNAAQLELQREQIAAELASKERIAAQTSMTKTQLGGEPG